MIFERTYKTKHEHLMEYLDKSLTYGGHPYPISEKSDTCHYGIKTSVRIYWDAGAYCIVTSTGFDVNLHALFPDDIMVERIIDEYDPFSIDNDFWKRGVK